MSIKDERDDFWDLDKLVPKKEKTLGRFASSVHLSPVEDSRGVETDTAQTPLSTRLTAASAQRSYTETSYVPENNSFIERVVIRREGDRYDFYESFRKAAILYFDVIGTPSDFVPFYSYMPQYSQMTEEQRAYYFYWRSELRRGRYLRSDYSYLYLYVYEILNLPDKIPAQEGLLLLCTLWKQYRRDLPRIDRYFSVWVQDYCLVWQLEPPVAELSEFIYDIVGGGFREFYLSDIDTACREGIGALVACLSDYDWHTARFAVGEHARSYRRHMEGALSFLMPYVLKQNRESLMGSRTAVLLRDAFPNSLCTHSVKCRLEITYRPLEQQGSLRIFITAAVKYIENRLRAALGVKSRLAVKGLPDDYRARIDFYFDTAFRDAVAKRARAQVPEYEHQYDAPKGEMSMRGADQIENESWETTARLVSEQELCEQSASAVAMPETPPAGIHAVSDAVPSVREGEKKGTAAQFEILSALLSGDEDACRSIARREGAPLDYFVELLNEQAVDIIGDTAVECIDGAYCIIEDYREEIEDWLCKATS